MTKRHGTARMRGLAAELKALRAKAGLNIREAARRAGMSRSTLNRIELGNRVITVADMAALLVVYGVVGVERERLLALTREASQPGWLEMLGSGMHKEMPALSSFESEATRIVHVTMLRFPGLLQIPDYVRAVMMSRGFFGDAAEKMVSARLGRQAVLTRPSPPTYLTIIDEAALRRPIGGPAVMVEQIRHVIAQAERPNIEVRVIPFDHGEHTGLDGTYVTLEFAKARTIVLLEHKQSSLFLDEPDDVKPYIGATASLLEMALEPLDSVNFLAHVAAEYDQR